ncbi:MAG TPA: long-chain fatty acid--CoA ligase [bacterium]|nr:long-chain fatty acid--CoA ligase [bacterium]
MQGEERDRPWDRFWPDHVPRSIDYPARPAWWILLRNLPDHAQRAAIRVVDPETAEERGRLTYDELAARSRALAAGLVRAGVRRGERAAFFLPNSPALIAAYFGTWLAGAVGVPCNPMHRTAELEYQLRDAEASVLLTSASLYPTAADVAARLRIPVFVAPVDAAAEPPAAGLPDGATPWTELLASADGYEPVAVDPDADLALLLYTGGTTGVPKGAMLTHRNIVANTVQFATWYGFEEGRETCIATLPLFHSGGMAGAMNVPLYAGASLVLFERFRPAGVARAIGRYRCTRFFGVPTMYAAMLNLSACRDYDLSSLRACRTSAAALPAAVKARFDELAGRDILVEGYGLSETSPLALANPVRRSKAGAIGIPLSDTDAAIVDPQTGGPVPHGEPGELVLRGPQVMRGYWRRPDETAAAFRGGWFHTGDIARLDEEGYFQIVDRLKDVINTAGYKVWPREVEEVLYAHPAVQLAAVVGLPDAYRGEMVKAFVVLRDGPGGVTTDDIIAHCRERLAVYKVPREVEFRAALPMSGAGKVLRRALRDGAPPAS